MKHDDDEESVISGLSDDLQASSENDRCCENMSSSKSHSRLSDHSVSAGNNDVKVDPEQAETFSCFKIVQSEDVKQEIEMEVCESTSLAGPNDFNENKPLFNMEEGVPFLERMFQMFGPKSTESAESVPSSDSAIGSVIQTPNDQPEIEC